jgi:hypothetical protein
MGALLGAFERAPSETSSQRHAKWAIGNAIAEMAGDAEWLALLRLLRDPRHGEERSALCRGLGAMKEHRTEAVNLLVELAASEEVQDAVRIHAVIAVGALRAPAGRGVAEAMSRHPDSWIRAEARRALRRIGK